MRLLDPIAGTNPVVFGIRISHPLAFRQVVEPPTRIREKQGLPCLPKISCLPLNEVEENPETAIKESAYQVMCLCYIFRCYNNIPSKCFRWAFKKSYAGQSQPQASHFPFRLHIALTLLFFFVASMKGPATSSMRRKQNGRNTTSGSDMGGMEDYSRRSASSTDGQVNGRSCLIRISEKKNSNQRHSISDRIKSLEVKKMRVSPSSSNTIRRFDGNIAMRTAYSPGFSKPSNDTSCVLTSERLIEIAATKRILEEWSKHSRLEQNDEISDNTSDTEDTSSGSTNGYGNTGARSSSSSSTKNIPDNTEEVDIPNTTTHVRHMGKDDETLLLNKKLRKRSIELKAKNIQIASLQSLLVRREADNLALRDEIERQRIEIEALRTERVNVNQVNVVVNDLQSPTGMLRNRVHNLERGKEAMKSRADHLLTLLVAFERDMNEALY